MDVFFSHLQNIFTDNISSTRITGFDPLLGSTLLFLLFLYQPSAFLPLFFLLYHRLGWDPLHVPLLAVFLSSFFLGSFFIIEKSQYSIGISPQVCTAVSGVLTQDSGFTADGRVVYSLEISHAEASDMIGTTASARATIISDFGQQFSRGSEVSFSLSCMKPESRNRQDHSGEWIWFPDREEVLLIRNPPGLAGLRSRLIYILDDRLSLLEHSSGFYSLLLLGRSRSDSGWQKKLFRNAGCLPFLALSGFHAGILIALLSGMAGNFSRHPFFILLLFPFLLLYLILTDFPVSLIRTILMTGLAGCVRASGKRGQNLKILAFSFWVQVLLFPGCHTSLSFQFSYLALSGIILLSSRIHYSFLCRLPGIIASPLSISLGVLILTIPLQLSAFGLFYPAAIPAGVLLAPILSVMIAGGLLFLMVPLSPLAALLEGFYQVTHSLIGAAGKIPSLTTIQTLLFLTVVSVAVLGYKRRSRRPL